MGRRKSKHDRKQETTVPAAHGWSVRFTAVLAATAVAGVLIGIGWFNATHDTLPVESAENAKPVGETSGDDQREIADSTPDSQASAFDFQKLKGQWVRADGDYVIDIQRVDNSGKLDVAYLNPKPIHVAKAEATAQGESARVFIELQDVNYPGSTYDLVYDTQRDQLAGIYFQAAQRQQFEVVFERQK